MLHKAKKTPVTSPLDLKLREIGSHFIPLLITSFCSIGLFLSLTFYSKIAIYASLISLVVCRSGIFSTSTAFLRARFPAEHLNRLIGIYGTISALLVLLQYPFFKWCMENYKFAIIFGTCVTAFNISYPLHILNVKSMKKAVSLQNDNTVSNNGEKTALKNEI